MSSGLVDLLGLLAKSVIAELISEMQEEQKTSNDSLASNELPKVGA